MTDEPTPLETFGDTVLFVGAVTMVLFCLAYWASAKWWKSEAGWHIQAWTFATAVLLVSLSGRTEDWLSRETWLWVRPPLYAVFIGLALWRGSMLWRAQLRRDLSTRPTDRTPEDVSDVPPRKG